MKKKYFALFFIAAFSAVFVLADGAGVSARAATAGSVKTQAVKTQSKKKRGWNYQKKKGKKIRISYRYKDGSYPVGVVKIGKDRYFFSKDKGKLLRAKKDRIREADGKRYFVRKNGQLFTGWVAYKKKLYYFSKKSGAMLKNRTVDRIELSNDGSAVWNLNASVRYKSVKLLEKITDRTASKSKQLRDAFYYIGNRRHFSYRMVYPNLSDKSWAKKYANQMLSTRQGNCYGFACTFSAVADAIGYRPKLATMRIRGPRDGAADGYTRHCQVKIGRYYYDPELHWYGGFNIYHCPTPGVSNKSRRLHSYRKMKGTIGAESTISGGTKKVRGSYVKKEDGVYYYYVGKKRKNGLYYIDGSLYRFKNGMDQETYEQYQAAIREGSSWEELRKLIGKPEKIKAADSCYRPDGQDRLHQYKNIEVTTFLPEEGEEIVVSVDAHS